MDAEARALVAQLVKWKCDRCGREGSVRVLNTDGVMAVAWLIVGDHGVRSPNCPDAKRVRCVGKNT